MIFKNIFSLLVVADGVGGWNQLGIDPSAYSKKLCKLIHNCCKKYEDKISFYCDIYNYSIPKFTETIIKNWIIQAVHENREKGSSTVCVVYLDKLNKTLYSSHMGDSCYLIARPTSIGNFQLIFKSEEQCHGFNIPYQVGMDGDNPCFSKTDRHYIERNDIIIVATDGLWDNVEVNKIIECLNDFSRNSNSIQIDTTVFAKSLSIIAEDLSRDKNHYSPFCKKAMEYNKSGKKYFGGKPDDITIVVAQVILCNETEDEKDMGYSKSVDTTVDGELENTNSLSMNL
jgi:protein phosphatase PTC7